MKSIEEIRKEEIERTKLYSEKQLNIYIRTCKLIKGMFSETFFWFVSIIPLITIPSIAVYLGFFELDTLTIMLFLIAHFLYWKFYAKKETEKLLNETTPELKMMIQVLEEIRNEKFNKNE
jgi:hypothetical protein